MIIPQRHFQGNWTYTNLFGLLIGLIIGHCIILFNTLFTGNQIELKQSAIVLFFSVLNTLSVSNTVSLMARTLNRRFNDYRLLIIVFYLTCLTGIAIGTELSLALLSLIFDIHYSGAAHLKLLLLNAFIALVVSTSMMLYEWQKSYFQHNSFKQEVEFLKLKRLKKKAQLQTIHAKVNPHFLYNSLNAIAALIPDNVEKAEAMTLKLAQLYRHSVTHDDENFSTIGEELEIIKNYLEIEQVRFGDKLQFELLCDESLFQLIIPRFLLQPLVENAVKHGLANALGQACIRLKIMLKNDQINIAVHDNGESFPKEINSGYGFKSTYEKLKLLYGNNYQIKLINSPEKHVSIVLPILRISEIAEVQ